MATAGANVQRQNPPAEEFVARSEPQLLTFSELEALSTTAKPEGALAEHLYGILNAPFLSNEAYGRGARPRSLVSPSLGPFLRAAFWNVEEGRQYDRITTALTDPEGFKRMLEAESAAERRLETDSGKEIQPLTPDAWQTIGEQLDVLRASDILVLNEVDLGVTRTGYRNVARDMAEALNMNYVFGVEFVEVDPLVLGLEQPRIDGDPEAVEMLRSSFTPDKSRFLGLHGNAILSKYPIRRASVRRLPLCYDWYTKEVESISYIEKGIRWGSDVAFLERVSREIRRGDRMAIIADLAVPDAPGGTITVVAAHLENKCKPACRQRQMRELLTWIRDVRNPLILAGDLNTLGTDGAPTSVYKIVSDKVVDPQFWGKKAVQWSTMYVMQVLSPAKYFRNYSDPTGLNIPVFSPKKEARLFNHVKNFRFADGMAFDFRGTDAQVASGHTGTLGNSNERAGKGFHYTFALERTYGGVVGRYKLDWFFIKGFAARPDDDDESYRFAPHFARTLQAFNAANGNRLSDHSPITVDLPFGEPKSSAPRRAARDQSRLCAPPALTSWISPSGMPPRP
jgi:endonuclease/exonuclease/phosphatase family metal-dependent hydrolase